MTRTGVYETQLAFDDALDRAGEEWAAKARHAVGVLCNTAQPFSSDDVVAIAGEPPGTGNAVGAFMNHIARELRLVELGTTRSRRPSAHGRKITRWRSPS